VPCRIERCHARFPNCFSRGGRTSPVNTTNDPNESAEARRRKFEADAGLIRSGNHLGWLAWTAQVYFSLFTGVDENATPRERLTTLLGEIHAETAIEGLIALLEHSDVPTLDTVAET
jgi:hypothetical protein